MFTRNHQKDHFLLPQTQKSDPKSYWLSQEQQSVLVQNWKSTEYDSAVLMKFSLLVPHEKVHLSKTAPEAIRPQDGGSEWGGVGIIGGGIVGFSYQEEI